MLETDAVLKVVLPAVLTIAVAFVTTVLLPFIQKKLKLSDAQLQLVQKNLQSVDESKMADLIRDLVKSAEERGRNGTLATGKEKFAYVYDLAKELAESFNISISDEHMKALIDSKVSELIASGVKKVAENA